MKNINSKFNPLKKVNEQYRKLAREGRTDHFGALKSKIDCCNKSWDRLYKRVSAILSNLRECAALYNDFKTMKDMMYRRLTNIEVSMNDIDQFHLMDIPARIAELEVCISLLTQTFLKSSKDSFFRLKRLPHLQLFCINLFHFLSIFQKLDLKVDQQLVLNHDVSAVE